MFFSPTSILSVLLWSWQVQNLAMATSTRVICPGRHVVLGTNRPTPPRLPSTVTQQQKPRLLSVPPICVASVSTFGPPDTMESPSPDATPSPEASPPPKARKSKTRRAVSFTEDDGNPEWEDEDDGAQLRGLGTTSHRSRNRSRPVIPLQKHTRAAPGKNARASATKRRGLYTNRMKGLNEDLKLWAQERGERAKELAVKHGIKVKEVLRRMINPSTFKPQRAPSLYNAKISRLMADLNADRGLGEGVKMTEVKEMVKADPSMLTGFTEEEEAEMLEEAREKASTKFRGTRANNKAAQADARATLMRLAREIMALAERCGMMGFAMFSRGHLHDLTIPMSIQSWGALDFFRECLHKDPADVATQFELWAVSQLRAPVNPDGLIPMQKECTSSLHDGLVRKLGMTKVAMNFANYIKSMLYGKGVGLIGWPKDVPFKRMSLQSSIGPLRKLRDALRNGTCHWKAQLTDAEKEKLSDQFDQWVEDGLATAPVEKEGEGEKTKRARKPRAKKTASTHKSSSSSKSKLSSGPKRDKDGRKSKKLSRKGKKAAAEEESEEEGGWQDVWEDPEMDADNSDDDEPPPKPIGEMSREEKRKRLVDLVERQKKGGKKKSADDDTGGTRKKPKAAARTGSTTSRQSGETSKAKRKRPAEDEDEEDEGDASPPPKKSKPTKQKAKPQQTSKPGVQPARKPTQSRPVPKPSWKGAPGAAASAAAANPPPVSPPSSPPRGSPPTPPPCLPPRISPPRDSVVPDSETQDSRTASAAATMPPPPIPGPTRQQLGDGEVVPDSESSRTTTAVPQGRRNCVKGVPGKKGPPGVRP
ncbi:hypothetical protein C8R43DRAFT_963795 [Mycena crocata]|nr:hypothetical protein C8R43DRAFT_963795 [Mycena crocata]